MHATTNQRVHQEFAEAIARCGGMSPCQAKGLGCLMTALVAAMPTFIEAFLKCKAQEPPEGGYDPGDRKRCDE